MINQDPWLLKSKKVGKFAHKKSWNMNKFYILADPTGKIKPGEIFLCMQSIKVSQRVKRE